MIKDLMSWNIILRDESDVGKSCFHHNYLYKCLKDFLTSLSEMVCSSRSRSLGQLPRRPCAIWLQVHALIMGHCSRPSIDCTGVFGSDPFSVGADVDGESLAAAGLWPWALSLSAASWALTGRGMTCERRTRTRTVFYPHVIIFSW